MPPALPLITLLTDFGDRDWFVASMKGVILTINPVARIVDLSHQITPHRIEEAAYCLQSCYRYFPEGTVHVAVVDPGVGSNRRPILVKTARYYFVAPDNGLLTPVLHEESDVEIRQLENPQYRLESPGNTFHGRDVFAPAAARLTTGTAAEAFGRPVSDPVMINWPQPTMKETGVRGQIVYVDRFGNLISNIGATQLGGMRSDPMHDRLRICVGAHYIHGLVTSYSEGDPGVPHALINSNGLLEVFVREQRATDLLRAAVGATIDVAF
ncbi:SAM hydrolase/SAM-dependent halogenase family protein [Nitrospira sp. NS4]|uniref:SAM hydrolase/SAM-dependent halogenase family protein n=1 Tax=Nitrospira sp. NS4 TaxID=3414498 RepID=UPI003C2E08BE